jgi:tRNA 2-selenouridine synthase
MDLQIHIPKVSIDVALKQSYPRIDVRSPKEFANFHMPSAINIPLFSNEEREEVGTLYVQKGRFQAVERGIQIFAQKIETFYHELKEIHEANHKVPIIVYCWRGGMRSKSIVTTMGTLGMPLIQLEGGIRSYRYTIMESLSHAAAENKTFIVLEGLTGTRKTDMLAILEQEGYPVIDLEKLANHRGSVFGQIGLEPNSQKQFDALLFERLRLLNKSNYYIIEAESKRVGRIVLPGFIVDGKENGIRIHIDAPLSERVSAIKDIYPIENHHEKIIEVFTTINKRLPAPLYQSIKEFIQKKDYDRAISQILTEYYDPKYTFALDKLDTEAHYIYYHQFSEGIKMVKEKLAEIIQSNQLNIGTNILEL